MKKGIILAAVLAWLFVPLSREGGVRAASGGEVTSATLMYAAEGADILREPDASAQVMGRLEAGDRVLAMELTGDGWYRVLWDGETGYVGEGFLELYLAEGDWGEAFGKPGPEEGNPVVSSVLIIAAVAVLILVYAAVQITREKRGNPVRNAGAGGDRLSRGGRPSGKGGAPGRSGAGFSGGGQAGEADGLAVVDLDGEGAEPEKADGEWT